MNAASSIISKESASERPASGVAAIALICEPFSNRRESLLSSADGTFIHEGKLSNITLTFVTRFLATSCLIAITRMLKSSLNIIFQTA